VQREQVSIASDHPCCDGVVVELRPGPARSAWWTRLGHLVRFHHLLLLLALLAVLAVPAGDMPVGSAHQTWVLMMVAGALLMWLGNRKGPVTGAVSFLLFAGAMLWHAVGFGDPVGIPEALLLTGLLAIAQMLFSRGMELLIGFGFGVLFFIGTFAAGSMGDATSLPVALSIVTAFVAAAWTVAVIIRREREVRDRHSNLVRSAPIAMFDFDLSGLGELLEQFRAQRVERLCEHLLSHPVVLGEAMAGVRIRSSNQAAADLFEIDGTRTIRVGDAFGPRNPMTVPLVQQVMVGIWDGLPSLSAELTARTAKGRSMHLLCAVSLPSGGPRALRHAPASAVDLTRQKALERDLHEQLADRDRFVASISHELRTPLTSVLGLAQSLLDQPQMPREDAADILRIMVREGQDLAHIIEDLLVGARLELGPLDIVTQEVDAEEEIDRLLASLEVDVVERRVADGLLMLGNKVRFRQILRNLLTNADKYGGPSIRIVTGRGGGVGYVDVRDNGRAIAEDLRSRMFEPYERLHSQRGTTDSVGLGLAVSRSLARAMGGNLEYDHDGVEGIFRVSLPLADRGVDADSSPAAAAVGH
jgi:signal transduction histidine kinase